MNKSFKNIESNLQFILNKHPRTRGYNINQILPIYMFYYTDMSDEDVSKLNDVMKQLPALSSIMRILTKIRSENPNLDTRPNQNSKIEDFKHI